MKKNREGFLVSENERECTKCHTIFPRTSKTVTICPKCNSERVKSGTVQYKMYSRAKSRATSNNLEFNISMKDIIIPEVCPVFGFKLECRIGKAGGQKNSPALDRIDPTKGYIKDNIRVISHLANMMKSHATESELLIFAKWIINELETKV